MHRLATVQARDNQPTNDITTQPISISASFTKVSEALNNMKLVHWPLMGGLLQPAQARAWAGCNSCNIRINSLSKYDVVIGAQVFRSMHEIALSTF